MGRRALPGAPADTPSSGGGRCLEKSKTPGDISKTAVPEDLEN